MVTDNNARPKAIERTANQKVREMVTALNRANLKTVDYAYLVDQIGQLIKGIPLQAASVPRGTVLYRGVIHRKKPDNVAFLSYPPVQLVTNFQRCNGPGRPMFYCSVDSAAVYAELDAQPEDRVYLSKWTVEQEFLFFRIPPDTSEQLKDDPVFSKIETFFETRFAQPIHETFSE
ncbi:hypothetical protein [Paraburkholderia sp. 22B1P]|uniref:hypothetical protein n=1 Tax=Paraburkholderia sp. 22B1P TaxID=3080498 RepID=UPI0030D60849